VACGGGGGNKALSGISAPSKDDKIAAEVPQSLASKGTVTVASDASYPPMEYFASDNKTVIGADVDIGTAIGDVLGLKFNFVNAGFDGIIPGLKAGKYDIGMSSFTDTKEREKTVDFVNYFTAGILWASPAGKTVDPNNACGLTVAVQSTTYEQTDELPAKSKACTKAGKKPLKLLPYENQDDATNAVVLGKAAAMSADSPVTAYAIKQSGGKLQEAGQITDAAPYGWPIAKGSSLSQAMQKALQTLMDNGTYDQICTKWGVQSGEIKTATVNGATS